MPPLLGYNNSVPRLLSIVHHAISLLCVLLLTLILIFWAATSKASPLIGYKPAGAFPRFQLTTLADSRLPLALYRETSLSPTAQRIEAAEHYLQVVQTQFREETDIH